MKFFKRFFILGLFALVGVSFCNAEMLYTGSRNSIDTTSNPQQIGQDGKLTCYMNPENNVVQYSFNNTNYTSFVKNQLYCFTGKIYVKSSDWYITSYYWVLGDYINNCPTCPTCPTIDQNYCTSNNLCPSCPSCPSQYTSLECQTEYNLIPVSDVTENYCTSNFDLISPSDCPISSGTGDTQRSALFLNNVQYAGASNIYVNISDLLDYSTTYIDSGSSFVLDVDGYVADTEYLDNILTVQEYHPSSEDFTTAFVSVLTLGLPYVVVVLFVVFIWKLIKKIFKS